MVIPVSWPMFQCHKVFRSVLIRSIDSTDAGFMMTPADPRHEPIILDRGFMSSFKPRAGGYVICDDEGRLHYAPAEEFNGQFHALEHMTFGGALLALRHGQKVQRDGWNGSGLWIELQEPDEHSKMTLPYLFLCYPSGARVPWMASQTDMLETDWRVIA